MKLGLHIVERPRIDSGFICQDHFDVTADVRVNDLANGRPFRVVGIDHSEITVALPVRFRAWRP